MGEVELLTPKDIRGMLKESLALVYRWAATGVLPCVRIPCPGKGTERSRSLVRFKNEDVLTFVERNYRQHEVR